MLQINITLSDEITPSDIINVGKLTTFDILPYFPNYTLTHTLKRSMLVNALGDGYSQTISSENAYIRADGRKNIAAHYGVNTFTLQFTKRSISAGGADTLWKFFKARLDEGNKPFFIYDPVESNFSIDSTGISTVGRYLVRLENPNQILNRELYVNSLFNFGGITLVEDRGFFWQGVSGYVAPGFTAVKLGVNVYDNVEIIDTIEKDSSNINILDAGDTFNWALQDSATCLLKSLYSDSSFYYPGGMFYVPGGIVSYDKFYCIALQPGLVLDETDSVNENWWIDVEDGTFRILTVNDAHTAWQPAIYITQNAGTPTGLSIFPPTRFYNTIELTNSYGLYSRNFLDTADLMLLVLDASNNLQFGRPVLYGCDGVSNFSFSLYSAENIGVYLNSNGNSYFVGGNVGIGTANPTAKLEVVGGSVDTHSDSWANINIYGHGVNGAPTYIGSRSKGTQASPTAVIADDTLLALQGRGYDGAGYDFTVEHISIKAAENFTSSNQGSYIVFRTVPMGATTGTERITITSEGFVGIGTTSPKCKLEVSGSAIFTAAVTPRPVGATAKGVYLSTADFDGERYYSGALGFSLWFDGTNYKTGTDTGSNGGSLIAGEGAGGELRFYTVAYTGVDQQTISVANLENYLRMTINDVGAVGIGAATPDATAILELSSTTRGFLPTRLTNAQITAISTPTEGLFLYASEAHVLKYFNGTSWISLSASTAISGTAGTIALFATTTTLGDSVIVQADSKIGIGTAAATYLLSVGGSARFYSTLAVNSTSTFYASIITANSVGISGRNAANSADLAMMYLDAADNIQLLQSVRMVTTGTSLVIGSTSLTNSAMLELVSTTRGLLISRMTTAQINAIDPVADGLMLYDATLHKLKYYNNTSWVTVDASGSISGTAGTHALFATSSTLGDSVITQSGSSPSVLTTIGGNYLTISAYINSYFYIRDTSGTTSYSIFSGTGGNTIIGNYSSSGSGIVYLVSKNTTMMTFSLTAGISTSYAFFANNSLFVPNGKGIYIGNSYPDEYAGMLISGGNLLFQTTNAGGSALTFAYVETHDSTPMFNVTVPLIVVDSSDNAAGLAVDGEGVYVGSVNNYNNGGNVNIIVNDGDWAAILYGTTRSMRLYGKLALNGAALSGTGTDGPIKLANMYTNSTDGLNPGSLNNGSFWAHYDSGTGAYRVRWVPLTV